MEYYVAKSRNGKSKYLSLIIFFKGSKETRKNQQKEAFVYTLLKNKRILTSLSGCFSMVFSQKDKFKETQIRYLICVSHEQISVLAVCMQKSTCLQECINKMIDVIAQVNR